MSNSRRLFLKGACVAVVGASGFTLARAKSTSVANVEPACKYALVHDETKCIGCDACSIACREVNQVPEGVSRLEIERKGPFGEYPNQQFHFTRISCQHCDDAPCVKVCPTGAAYKDPKTGIVVVDEWKCVGCQYCIAACPYQVRFINPVTKAADKCDFCKETRLKEGKLPACVTACPTKALTFGDITEPQSQVVQVLKSAPSYRTKTDLGTRPKVFRIASQSGEIKL
ncbi:4Fe-4S dicluster domain-containing protein [Shewanella sp. Isolate13]|uniref:4Fe-4S dicluster domain-containing protein n=1 Tax=Shewanella sp. Isolate13 TaxID=2908531 RepID=UPI001EFC457E|nr:4Fe-4S dicluster domain-containing protein [Shewanella sp. Isolate13]MCG9729464.1 4Fe-4S dicluster domain-containing protein [Shewanella sp. Isolate13]